MYCKAVPDTTWSQLEVAFRNFKFNTFLIARVSRLSPIIYHIADPMQNRRRNSSSLRRSSICKASRTVNLKSDFISPTNLDARSLPKGGRPPQLRTWRVWKMLESPWTVAFRNVDAVMVSRHAISRDVVDASHSARSHCT